MGKFCTKWGWGYAEGEANLADLVVVIEQFLPLDHLEVELELILDERTDKDQPVALARLGQHRPQGHLQEVRLLCHEGQLLRDCLDLALDGVRLAQLEVLRQ